MLDNRLHPDVQKYICTNERADVTKLLLKGGEVAGVPMKEIVEQIESRNKAVQKAPFLVEHNNILFPPKLSMEQCSSQITAAYKASKLSGQIGADLTGGFGIDAYFLSKSFAHFHYVEMNEALAAIVKHNFEALAVTNIETHSTTAENYLDQNVEYHDVIYLDPARRDQAKRKVFLFEDCTPNVIKLKDSLLKTANRVVVKASPLVDISNGIAALENVCEIHVLAINNECKELLFFLEKSSTTQRQIYTANYKNNSWETFNFTMEEEANFEASFGEPKTYLYEPNSAILKAGAYKIICKTFNIQKLHPNSHLYTSTERVSHFPGRTFKILHNVKYDRKAISRVVTNNQANITTRNFPDSVEKIRKKTKLKDGGKDYLFATTDINNNKIILVTEKVS